MKRMIEKIEDNKLFIITFMTSLLIIVALYIINDVTPFGKKSLLCIDFYHQYGPMLANLYDRIKSGSSLIYSFSVGFGLPFFRNFLNYLSSPFNLIMFFFDHNHVITSYSFIIGAKAIAASVTMVYFLSKKFNTKELYLIPLGLIYAFCGYFSAYYWNIMWLDGMVFLPIITLGIENIVNKGKWKMYTISLALMIIANYFIGYMICCFSCVYFFFYLITKINIKKGKIKEEIKNKFKIIVKFGIGSLLAGALGACLLLPMFDSMKSISATGGEIPTSQYYAFEIEDYLKSHFTGAKTTTFASDEITPPNISCGILSIALLLAFFINLNIPLRKKICYFLILSFFIIAFFYAPLDYILHGFHVPNDLPYRYSFLYSFVLVLIGAYALINIKKIKYPLIVVGYILLMMLMLSISNDKWVNLTSNMIYINMILLTLYFIFYTGIHFLNNYRNIFYYAIIFITCVDVTVSIAYNWNITQILSVFYEDYKPTKELLNFVEDYDNEKFYRIENTNMMTLNDGAWYNYNGVTTFSSMAYEDMAKLQHNLGMPGNEINSYSYVHSTPIYDLMFDVKYMIGNRNDFNRYEVIYSEDEIVNEFTYNVGLAYGVNKDILNWNYTSDDPFEIQNDYIYKATDVINVLEPATLINTEEIYTDEDITILKYQYENTHDNFYFYSRDNTIDYVLIGESLYYKNENYADSLAYSDELTYSYLEDYDDPEVINIHSDDEYLTIYVAYNLFYEDAFKLYNIDAQAFKDAYNILKKNKLDITSFKESKITGNITLNENQMVYTSIPYDKGWKVLVDGKPTNTYALANSLLVFDCKEGTHSIIIKYEIPYFKAGLLISFISALIIIFEKKILKLVKSLFKKLKIQKKVLVK